MSYFMFWDPKRAVRKTNLNTFSLAANILKEQVHLQTFNTVRYGLQMLNISKEFYFKQIDYQSFLSFKI